MKDWTGNHTSSFATLGARNYAKEDRETHDYYATDPRAGVLLLSVEQFAPVIWECACGEGHLSKVFEAAGHIVISSDLVPLGYGLTADFLNVKSPPMHGLDIITNPPYSLASEFVEHAHELIDDGHKIAMFLKLQFLEGVRRKELFGRYPPKTVYVSSGRLRCAKNGDFERYKDANAVAYAWYVWQKGFTGDSVLKWIN